MSISLFTGQLSLLATAAIRRSLSSFSISHSSAVVGVHMLTVLLHEK